MIYDYAIYGGGPTGINTAIILSNSGFKVCIVEKSRSFGGCWKIEWDNNYFTEHSPKVLGYNSDLLNFLNLVKLDSTCLADVYGSKIDTTWQLFSGTFLEMPSLDNLKIAKGVILSKLGHVCDISFEEWMTENYISKKGRKVLYKLCILVADIPEKVRVLDLFESMKPTRLVQFKNPEEWINNAYEILESNGSDIFLNTELKDVDGNAGHVVRNNVHYKIYAKKHLICIDPYNLLNLIVGSRFLKEYSKIDLDQLATSYYPSISFQIHFEDKIKIPSKWFWSFDTNYHVILLPVSEYMNVTRGEIKYVLSCTIIDQNVIHNSNYIKVINDAVNDIVYELGKVNSKIGKYHVTYQELKVNNYNNGIKWNSNLSGYVRVSDIIRNDTKHDNIKIIGPFNVKGISTFNNAIESSNLFLIDEGIIKESKLYKIIMVILLLIIIIIIFRIIYNKKNI